MRLRNKKRRLWDRFQSMAESRRHRERELADFQPRGRKRKNKLDRRPRTLWARRRLARLIIDAITGRRVTRWTRRVSDYRESAIERLTSRNRRTLSRVYLTTDDARKVGRLLYRRK